MIRLRQAFCRWRGSSGGALGFKRAFGPIRVLGLVWAIGTSACNQIDLATPDPPDLWAKGWDFTKPQSISALREDGWTLDSCIRPVTADGSSVLTQEQFPIMPNSMGANCDALTPPLFPNATTRLYEVQLQHSLKELPSDDSWAAVYLSLPGATSPTETLLLELRGPFGRVTTTVLTEVPAGSDVSFSLRLRLHVRQFFVIGKDSWQIEKLSVTGRLPRPGG